MKIFRKYILTLILLQCSLLLCLPAKAQNDKMKGLNIFKTALNTNWTENKETFVIGIYGESSVFFVLSAISRARKINNSVVFVKKIANQTQIEDCNIVFVTNTKKDELKEIKAISKSKELLVITEDCTGTGDFDINLKSNDAGMVEYEINKLTLSPGLSFTEKFETEASKVYQ